MSRRQCFNVVRGLDWKAINTYKVCKTIDVNQSSALPNIKSMILKDVFLSNYQKQLGYSIVPCSELRPVALVLTPHPGKLLEKLMCATLQNCINNSNLMSNSQHGFRKERSMITAICAFFNIIYMYINQNKKPIIVYLDLKTAFDTVSHSKLLAKMQKMGLDDVTIQWFKSYLDLSNRSQCVNLNNVTSSMLVLRDGIT